MRVKSPVLVSCLRWSIAALSAGGCAGAIDDSLMSDEPMAEAPGTPAPVAPSAPVGGGAPTAPPSGAAMTPPAPVGAAATTPALSITRETLRLLPFETRLNRLATLLGVPTSDPLLAPILAKRLELGDYDQARGVNADASLSASRGTLWIKLLRPVCQSSAFKGRYANIATDPSPLVSAAFGRPADEADLEAFRTGAAKAAAASRPEVICLAALSSLEFVAR